MTPKVLSCREGEPRLSQWSRLLLSGLSQSLIWLDPTKIWKQMRCIIWQKLHISMLNIDISTRFTFRWNHQRSISSFRNRWSISRGQIHCADMKQGLKRWNQKKLSSKLMLAELYVCKIVWPNVKRSYGINIFVATGMFLCLSYRNEI